MPKINHATIFQRWRTAAIHQRTFHIKINRIRCLSSTCQRHDYSARQDHFVKHSLLHKRRKWHYQNGYQYNADYLA
ncbi:hypothetical protein BN128_3721 [Cronobacter sakazakii 696]|nr:hypothetical protein BN128_3721 [Cronobacter sakazakii 696]